MRKNEPEDMGGCEAEQPAGWYCTRDFHHNGPCALKRLPATPSVEQDELLLAAKEVLANGHQHDVGDVFVGTCEAAERLQRAVDARAASTPANVAQGDEPPDGDKEHWRRLYLAERECRQKWQQQVMFANGVQEAVTLTAERVINESRSHFGIYPADDTNRLAFEARMQALAAPPAQTTLTDDAFLSALRELVRLRDKRDAFHKGEGTWTGDDEDQAIAAFELARRALTAVQSAIGDKT